MPIIVRSVQYKKKIGMVVLRLLIWVVQRLICFMKERNMVSKGDKTVIIFNACCTGKILCRVFLNEYGFFVFVRNKNDFVEY